MEAEILRCAWAGDRDLQIQAHVSWGATEHDDTIAEQNGFISPKASAT
jgi:hypothetical protein